MELYTEDATKILFTFALQTIEGFQNGEFITITPRSLKSKSRLGLGSRVVPIPLKDPRADLELKLARAGKANGILSKIAALDEITGGGALPLSVSDMQGEYHFFSLEARIVQEPVWRSSGELGSWFFELYNMVSYQGGYHSP